MARCDSLGGAEPGKRVSIRLRGGLSVSDNLLRRELAETSPKSREKYRRVNIAEQRTSVVIGLLLCWGLRCRGCGLADVGKERDQLVYLRR